MTGEDGEFWDKRYREEGAIWGECPSPTAVLLAARLPPRSRVLDVGFGYGRDLVFLAGQGFRVAGVETSGDGHALARRRLEARGLRAEPLHHGRFEDAAAPREGFDAVLNHRMAHLLITAAAVADFAARLRAAVRPGGLLALAARGRPDHDPAEMAPVEPGVYEYRRRPGHRIRYWDDEAVAQLCAAGFDLVELLAVTEPETLARPKPCHLLLLLARAVPVQRGIAS